MDLKLDQWQRAKTLATLWIARRGRLGFSVRSEPSKLENVKAGSRGFKKAHAVDCNLTS